MKSLQLTCRCHAYKFPHRLLGGACGGPEQESDDLPWWARERAAFEHREAAALNRQSAQ